MRRRGGEEARRRGGEEVRRRGGEERKQLHTSCTVKITMISTSKLPRRHAGANCHVATSHVAVVCEGEVGIK